jgi:DNA-binding MarR family transcriptional regulator
MKCPIGTAGKLVSQIALSTRYPVSVYTEAAELMDTVAGLRRVVRRRLARTLPGPQLPTAQVELLLAVEAEPGVGIAGAARALGLADNSVSALLQPLVEAGLVRRETDPTDRRAARLHLTPSARARLARWRSARADLVGNALDGLGPTDRKAVTGALPALRRLLEILRDER